MKKRSGLNVLFLFIGLILGIAAAAVFVVFLCKTGEFSIPAQEITDLRLRTEDGRIDISWVPPSAMICKTVTVSVTDGEDTVFEETLSQAENRLSFDSGEHGKLYTVSAQAQYYDERKAESVQNYAMFLRFDELPDIPLLRIDTFSGDDPSYEEAIKPDDSLWGQSQTGNDYLSGQMTLCGGKSNYDGNVRIRTHGNMSVITSPKKSYSLKLGKSCDLLGLGSRYESKNWVLLRAGNSLNTYIGDYIGELCGMVWQPKMKFVNVILNGDWKGCYCLTQAVCAENAHGLISSTGYLIENNAYFWNENGVFFKTDRQIHQLAYTLKYPDVGSPNSPDILRIQEYMQAFEDSVYSRRKDYAQYVDESTLVGWILAKDILGEADGGGSNMYIYKYDFNTADPTSSKLKFGPLWDFDGSFLTPGSWSVTRSGLIFWYPELFTQRSFQRQYKERWDSLAPGLLLNVTQQLNQLDIAQGDALNESWRLDAERWQYEANEFISVKWNAINWFASRIVWMNEALEDYGKR